MFRKILIANRGEIALRIARSCRRLGLAVATVHSDADADAPHVRQIGESVRLGPAPAAESYLHIERVVQAARAVGADAVHPGYGFLSENAAFADALQAAGIAFVGPTAQTLRDFGDKAAAKGLARAAGLPVIPGSDGASANAAAIETMARQLGLPVLLKAAAGGGGKGIRIVTNAAALPDAIAGAMREGRSAFGDPSLLVERYLPRGRHVEVQILGDGQGGVWHLWERECSLQRRHQKVVEEAPALPLPPGLRERLLDRAVALGRHVSYRALGTVEFLVVGDEAFFLEVNPRLQVEHPVTEAVTGLDLVELQLRAAAGEALALPETPRCDGHAIELRVYAEDPAAGFVPAVGRLQRVAWPADGTRVETGVEAGSMVTPHYDPMVAKLVVLGRDRAEALARARSALAATRLVGPAHNLGYLEALLRQPEVTAGPPDTGTIDGLPPLLQPPAWRDAAAHVAAAWALARTRRHEAGQPVSSWPAFTHWRLGAAADTPLQPQFELQGDTGRVLARVTGDGSQGWLVHAGERCHQVLIDGEQVTIDGVQRTLAIGAEPAADGERIWIGDGRHTETLTLRPARAAERRAGSAGGAELLAPLTGTVLEVRVAEGERVDAGQVMIVLESMKMELRLAAPCAGTARALAATVGATVDRGAVLAVVQATES